MAISRDKKQALVAEIEQLLKNSKAVASATFAGITVKDMQELRKLARESNVTVKVVKNRLVKVAMNSVDHLKDVDASALHGQLIYAFSSEDEVAAAQVLGKFAKENTQMELVGAFMSDGTVMDAATVKTLADLPGKDQLIGQIVETLLSPLHGITGGLTNEDLEFRKATN